VVKQGEKEGGGGDGKTKITKIESKERGLIIKSTRSESEKHQEQEQKTLGARARNNKSKNTISKNEVH